MLTIVDDEWVVDIVAMLCKNNYTGIVVGFEKSKNTYNGKIKDMPLELMARLAKMKDGDLLLKKAVLDAEEIFNREIFKKKKEEKRN